MLRMNSRDEEIRLIWTENQWLYIVTGFLGGILFCLIIQLSINNLTQLLGNLLPEAVSILVIVTVIELLNRRRDKRNVIKQLQEQLVRDASSIVNDTATNAVHQLKKRGWLRGDKSLLAGAGLWQANLQGANLYETNLDKAKLGQANLQGANLEGASLQRTNLLSANLQRANLSVANLQNVTLWQANLQGAALIDSDLQRAQLGRADLRGAHLIDANLQGANLRGADLQDVDLTGANLQEVNLEGTNLRYARLEGANLEGASLKFADLRGANFQASTMLPDGTYWTPDTDMTLFTYLPLPIK